jgi:hypothetical protein
LVEVGGDAIQSLDAALQRAKSERKTEAFGALVHVMSAKGSFNSAKNAALRAESEVVGVRPNNNFQHYDDLHLAAMAAFDVAELSKGLTLLGQGDGDSRDLSIVDPEVERALNDTSAEDVLAWGKNLSQSRVRYAMYVAASRALFRRGMKRAAMKAATEALSAAQEIPDDTARSEALRSMASWWLELGEMRRAREAADDCGIAADRLSALAHIVIVYSGGGLGNDRASAPVEGSEVSTSLPPRASLG